MYANLVVPPVKIIPWVLVCISFPLWFFFFGWLVDFFLFFFF